MALGECRAEPVAAAVGVAVQLGRGLREGVERLRERAERALVGRELDHPLEAELPLDLLDRLPRLIGDDVPDGGLKKLSAISASESGTYGI